VKTKLMRIIYQFLVIVVCVLPLKTLVAQQVIELPITVNPNTKWNNPEKQFHSSVWNTQVVTNVSKPTMAVYRPANPNGTAVVICPGGGLYAHSINSEGVDVAKWLVKKGVTAFVLKYRLVPTGEDATKDMMADGEKVLVRAKKILPAAVSDALNAIQHVRDNSIEYKVDKNKIGIMGFSAGGAVTMGTRYTCEGESCPDFLGPVYAWMNIVEDQTIDDTAGPIFVACATDDPLRLAPASVAIYQQWVGVGLPAELHMYAKGGHGFGMKKQDLPSDEWIQHFYDWMVAEGLTE